MGWWEYKFNCFILKTKIFEVINDPFVEIKEEVTLGITALFFLRVLIDKKVCDLDVELKFSLWGSGHKRRSVRPLNFYMIWVQTGASQVGFYLKG